MTRTRWAVGGIAVLWLLAIGAVWVSPFFIGAPLGLIMAGIAWVMVLIVVAVLGVVVARRVGVTVGGVVGTLVLAALLLNWSAVAPAAYFETHRALFDRAATSAHPDDSYYGSRLPLALRPLSAGGRVSGEEEMLFFPQWMGIPDDAGGYFWSPHRSPEGADMYGMVCTDPADLGDGWWACGL